MVYLNRRFLGLVPTSSPANGKKIMDSFMSVTNFDTSMMIIVAALLSALICAVGLNLIFRCALRCSPRFGTETPEQVAARISATGLKKRTLRQLPVVVYGSETDIPTTECSICLGEFADGERVRVLPRCNHGFHVTCIDTWLASHSSCPLCRHSLLERADVSNSVGGVGSFSVPENITGRDDGVVVVVDQI